MCIEGLLIRKPLTVNHCDIHSACGKWFAVCCIVHMMMASSAGLLSQPLTDEIQETCVKHVPYAPDQSLEHDPMKRSLKASGKGKETKLLAIIFDTLLHAARSWPTLNACR
jgi:hypothetical protein